MAEYDLLTVPQLRMSVPVAGPFTADFGFRASLKATLSLDTNSTATVTTAAALDGEAIASIGIGAGFSVAGVGISISGGIEGGITLEGRSSLTFQASGSNLSVSMPASTLNIDMVAGLYIDVPGFDVGVYDADGLAEDIASLSSSLGSSGRRITYRLGSIKIIEGTTPSYSISFNVSSGRFSGASASGSWRFGLSNEAKASIRYIENKIDEAIAALPWPIGD